MRHFAFLWLLTVVSAPPHSQAAPVPKRTNAKPAVIDAGTELHARSVQERVVSLAHIAILDDKKVAEFAIVRRHLRDPKDTRELIAWLEKNFRIVRVKGKNLIRVSFQDGNAKEQAAIINLVVDHYLKTVIGSRRDHAMRAIKSIKDANDALRRRGKLTPEEAAEAEKAIEKREEDIRALPALVEHAQVP